MIQELSLWWRCFSPLEERLLAAVRSVLGEAAQRLFDRQVAAINHVQRLPPSWEEIDFYSLRSGKPHWVDSILFPRRDEFQLARVVFTVSGTTYASQLSVVSGHIFDLDTRPGPRSIAFRAWAAEASVALLADPLRASE